MSYALQVGFSFFKEADTAQGLQNQMFSIFMLLYATFGSPRRRPKLTLAQPRTIFGSLCQQMMPLFCTKRALYEARERPSKTYSWQAFMTAQILVELPWQTLMAVISFFCWCVLPRL
mgnify:FL=1